jgi:hypothetical protein
LQGNDTWHLNKNFSSPPSTRPGVRRPSLLIASISSLEQWFSEQRDRALSITGPYWRRVGPPCQLANALLQPESDPSACISHPELSWRSDYSLYGWFLLASRQSSRTTTVYHADAGGIDAVVGSLYQYLHCDRSTNATHFSVRDTSRLRRRQQRRKLDITLVRYPRIVECQTYRYRPVCTCVSRGKNAEFSECG